MKKTTFPAICDAIWEHSSKGPVTVTQQYILEHSNDIIDLLSDLERKKSRRVQYSISQFYQFLLSKPTDSPKTNEDYYEMYLNDSYSLIEDNEIPLKIKNKELFPIKHENNPEPLSLTKPLNLNMGYIFYYNFY